MALIPWKSKHRDDTRELAPTTGFRTELDRLFDSFLHGIGREDSPWGAMKSWGPPVDVEETDNEVTVRAEIPGVTPDDLQLSISGNALVISGEKKETVTKRPEAGYVVQERRYGAFRREVPLPTAVDPDDVKAEYENGVLQVRLKKSAEALPRRIPIRAS
jgi:HSP20 family protein